MIARATVLLALVASTASAADVDGNVFHRVESSADRPAQAEMGEAIPLPLPERAPKPAPPNGLRPPASDEGAAAAEGYNYPAPFTRFRLFPNTSYPKAPHAAVGKLFFKRGAQTFVCSAAAIGPYAIWTAAHCLYDDGMWSTDIEFAPQYRSNSRPKGTWTAVGVVVKAGWVTSGATDNGSDMGIVILNALNGKGIGQVVPPLGFAWNQPLNQHWAILGYPSGTPFNGETQIVCAASTAYIDTNFAPAPTGVGCDQTGGSSGGPWILSYRDANYLNGVISYRNVLNPLELLSPYFGDGAKALYDCAQTSTPSGPGPSC